MLSSSSTGARCYHDQLRFAELIQVLTNAITRYHGDAYPAADLLVVYLARWPMEHVCQARRQVVRLFCYPDARS